MGGSEKTKSDVKASRRQFIAAGALTGVALAERRVWSQTEAPIANKPMLSLAGYAYDRVQGLVDGRVPVEGFHAKFEQANIYALNANAMGGEQAWSVQEIGLHPYMLAYANDSFRDYALVPVFPLRMFRHRSIFVRTDGDIKTPADLRGKTVATPGYSQSSLTWIRGFLKHEYGVLPEEINWVVTSKSSDQGAVSKNESVFPSGVPIVRGPVGKDESDLLQSGDVDAVFHALEPKAYIDGDPNIVRLFGDYRKIERDYFTKTGIFPIMHAVAIRRDIVKKHPQLPVAVFNAYSQAKHLMYSDLQKQTAFMMSLPWAGKELEETRLLLGENFWPYGIKPNRKALEALFLYSYEQGLSKKQLTIEELFDPTTLELDDVEA